MINAIDLNQRLECTRARREVIKQQIRGISGLWCLPKQPRKVSAWPRSNKNDYYIRTEYYPWITDEMLSIFHGCKTNQPIRARVENNRPIRARLEANPWVYRIIYHGLAMTSDGFKFKTAQFIRKKVRVFPVLWGIWDYPNGFGHN